MDAHTALLDLGDAGAAGRARVGGKASVLGELAAAGLPVPPGFVVTPAELDVLRCFRDGLGQIETATQLAIAESTVKQRAVKACGKLGAKSRTQAVAIAVARNYL